MSNKLDINEITKKLNIGGLAQNIRSMVNPAGLSEKVDPNDALGKKLSEINVLTKELITSQEKQVQGLSRLTGLLEGIYSDLEAIRHPASEPAAAAPVAEKAEESVKAEPAAEAAQVAPEAQEPSQAPVADGTQSEDEAKS